MKILTLSHLFPHEAQPAKGTFVYELIHHLSPLCQQEVIAPVPWVPLPWNLLETYRLWPHGIRDLPFGRVHHPPYVVLPRKWLYSYLGAFYWAGIQKTARYVTFDLIHAHQPYPDGYAAMRLKHRRGVPLVVTLHGDVLLQRILASNVLRSKVRHVLESADAIIHVASYQQHFCTEIGLQDLTNVFNIPNGVDTECFRPVRDKRRYRKNLGLESTKKLVLYVGNLYPPKGLPVLLESISQLCAQGYKNLFELVIVGDGPLRKDMIRCCSQKNIQKVVRFVGAKPHSEIPSWLAAADILVLPSTQEGFPTVIPEALACGLPVIATTVGGIPDIINSPEKGILVEPGDSQAFATALQSALNREWNNETIAEYGATYAWKNIARKTFEIYQDLV